MTSRQAYVRDLLFELRESIEEYAQKPSTLLLSDDVLMGDILYRLACVLRIRKSLEREEFVAWERQLVERLERDLK